jgi:hypothetical protein
MSQAIKEDTLVKMAEKDAAESAARRILQELTGEIEGIVPRILKDEQTKETSRPGPKDHYSEGHRHKMAEGKKKAHTYGEAAETPAPRPTRMGKRDTFTVARSPRNYPRTPPRQRNQWAKGSRKMLLSSGRPGSPSRGL